MRLIPFEFNNQQTYILEFGNLYIRIYDKNDNLVVVDGGTLTEITTPYTNEDIENIDYIQKGDVLFLVDGKHFPKQLERLGSNSWQLIDYELTIPPFKEQKDKMNAVFTKSSSIYYVDTNCGEDNDYHFQDSDVGKIFNIETFFNAQTLSMTNIGTTTQETSSILVGSSWTFVTAGKWAGKITILISDDDSNWKEYKVVSSTIDGNGEGSYNADITGDFDGIKFVKIKTKLTTDTSCQFTFQSIGFYENIAFKIMSKTSSTRAVINLIEYNEKILESANNYTVTNPLTYNKVDPIQPPAWEDNAYPKHITFYQDRLVFANSQNYPFTIWASETSNYYSFKIHSELLDSDSIQTNVVGDGLNEITALVSLMSLIAFTENGVFRTGIDVWNATCDFALTRQSRGGSSSVRPVTIDNSCIYVKPTKDVIKDFYYQYQIDAYAGDQLDILARNLFENKKVKQLAFQEQDKTIWVLFEDGSMAYCCYMKEQEVLGWNKFETNGNVISIATIMRNFNDTLYLAVERENGICIERLDKRFNSKEVKDQIFLDSAIVHEENGEYFNTITGLNHLNGQKVDILADGFVIKNMFVSNGTITLENYVTKAIVGLPYETKVETLDINYAGNGQATFGEKRRAVGAIVQFIDSCDCKMGTSNGPIDEVIFRTDEQLGTPTPIKTEKKDINFTSHHSEEEHIVIVQDKPLPFTVSTINQKVTMGDK